MALPPLPDREGFACGYAVRSDDVSLDTFVVFPSRKAAESWLTEKGIPLSSCSIRALMSWRDVHWL